MKRIRLDVEAAYRLLYLAARQPEDGGYEYSVAIAAAVTRDLAQVLGLPSLAMEYDEKLVQRLVDDGLTPIFVVEDEP